MPDTAKLLKQNNVNFKRYTGIEKATFEQMLEAMTEHEANKAKSGRSSDLIPNPKNKGSVQKVSYTKPHN